MLLYVGDWNSNTVIFNHWPPLTQLQPGLEEARNYAGSFSEPLASLGQMPTYFTPSRISEFKKCAVGMISDAWWRGLRASYGRLMRMARPLVL